MCPIPSIFGCIRAKSPASVAFSTSEVSSSSTSENGGKC